jgi:dipeptide transport system substrate-binding protein
LVSDQAKRTELYLQAQKIFYEEAPALLIAYPVGYIMSSPKVEGLKPQPVGGQAFFGVSLKQ